MEKAEREFLLLHLAESRERLLDAVEGLSKEQQRFRAAPHRWSVADCVEHVSIVEKMVVKEIQAVVIQPPRPSVVASLPDDVILDGVPNRSSRCASPLEAFPTSAGRTSISCCGSLKPLANAVCASPQSPRAICARIPSRIRTWANWIAISGSCFWGRMPNAMCARPKK